MKRLRTRRFYHALYGALGFSALFLAWFGLFGQKLAVAHFEGIANLILCDRYIRQERAAFYSIDGNRYRLCDP